MIKKIFFLCVSFLLVCCCLNAQNKKNMDLDEINGHWMLSVMNSDKVEKDQASLYVDIKEMRIGGKAFCNSFFASIDSLTDKRIKFSNYGSTRMACPDLRLETQYMQSLLVARTYNLSDDVLYLKDMNGNELLRFVRFDYTDGKFNNSEVADDQSDIIVVDSQKSKDPQCDCWFSRIINKVKSWFK